MVLFLRICVEKTSTVIASDVFGACSLVGDVDFFRGGLLNLLERVFVDYVFCIPIIISR